MNKIVGYKHQDNIYLNFNTIPSEQNFPTNIIQTKTYLSLF